MGGVCLSGAGVDTASSSVGMLVLPNKSLQPTLLSSILLRLVSRLRRFKSSLITLRKPQGG